MTNEELVNTINEMTDSFISRFGPEAAAAVVGVGRLLGVLHCYHNILAETASTPGQLILVMKGAQISAKAAASVMVGLTAPLPQEQHADFEAASKAILLRILEGVDDILDKPKKAAE